MDIGYLKQGFNLNARNIRSLALSYRKYYHLGDISKDIFDKFKDDYTPEVRAFALFLFKLAQRKGIWRSENFSKRFFQIAEKRYHKLEALRSEQYKVKGYRGPASLVKEKYLLKEIKFRGFVPLDTFHHHDKYGYFIINRMIEGKWWIYPKKFADHYNALQMGIPYYSEYMGKIGINGITRYWFSHTPL